MQNTINTFKCVADIVSPQSGWQFVNQNNYYDEK